MTTSTANNIDLLNEVGDVYDTLRAVYNVLIMTADDTHSCLQMPQHYVDNMRDNNRIVRHQAYAIESCLKKLERVAPDECDPTL